MVCPYCNGETEVINSRSQKRSNQVWRRRSCKRCKSIFTTHETIYLPAVFIVKGPHGEQPFNSYKLFNELFLNLRDHKRAYEAAKELSDTITQNVLKNAANGLILAENISIETARVLKRFDKQAYLRFLAEHPSVQ